jgi:hypothetical protein
VAETTKKKEEERRSLEVKKYLEEEREREKGISIEQQVILWNINSYHQYQ